MIKLETETIRANVERGQVNIFKVPKDEFKKLIKISEHHDKSDGSEWVVYGGVTFFKKQERIEL